MAKDLTSFLKTTGQLKKEFRFKANSELEQTVKEWIEERRLVAEQILKDKGNYSTGALANSIVPRTKELDGGGLLVEVLADSYWKFMDKGVNGVFNNLGSPYSFRNLGVGYEMHRSFSNFIKNKGITVRDNQTYEGLAYALAKSVKKEGIKGNEFMSVAYSDEAIAELSQRLEKDVARVFNSL